MSNLTSKIEKLLAHQYLWLKWIKWLVFLITSIFIYFKIANRSEQLWLGVLDFFNSLSGFGIVFLVLLMASNWLLESAKWYFISKKISPISFLDATKSVLSGLCLGFITPHAIGDYLGRMLYSKEKSFIKTISPILLSRIVQFYITVFYGVLGFFILKKFFEIESQSLSFLVVMLVVIFSFLIFLVLTNKRFIDFVFGFSPTILKFSNKILQPTQNLTWSDHLLILFLAFLRYVVFSIQYLYVLWVMGARVFELKTIAGVWMVYFAKSVLPSFNFLTEISVREASALYFLSDCGIENDFLLIVSGLFIWILNILSPTIFGLIFVLSAKGKKL